MFDALAPSIASFWKRNGKARLVSLFNKQLFRAQGLKASNSLKLMMDGGFIPL